VHPQNLLQEALPFLVTFALKERVPLLSEDSASEKFTANREGQNAG